MRKMVSKVLALAVAGVVFSLFADTTYTPGNEGWGEALTVAEGETAIIDAGGGGEWAGAITVSSNAVLKTRGILRVNGTTTVVASGTLDVESGTSYFTFGSRTMSGTLYVRQGAQLDMNRSDPFNYHGGFAVQIGRAHV